MASSTGQRCFLSCLVTIALIGAVNSTANFTILGNITGAANETLNNLLSNSSGGRVRRAADILDSFPTYNQVTEWMKSLQAMFPGAVAVESVANTSEGRPITSIIINHAQSWNTVFIVANLHAFEWGSSISALYVIKELATNSASYPELAFRFIIMPIANPDGYEYSRVSDRLWRKNRSPQAGGERGVDLNRNFGYKWHTVQSDAEIEPFEETYRGPEPFSEVETKFIHRSLSALKENLVLYVDLHAPGHTINYPWGHTKRHPTHADKLQSIAEAGAKSILDEAGTHYKYGTLSKLQGVVVGTSIDYCYAIDVNACIGMKVGGEIELETTRILQVGKETMAAIKAMSLKALEYKTSL